MPRPRRELAFYESDPRRIHQVQFGKILEEGRLVNTANQVGDVMQLTWAKAPSRSIQ
jgi:hypothetical protein